MPKSISVRKHIKENIVTYCLLFFTLLISGLLEFGFIPEWTRKIIKSLLTSDHLFFIQTCVGMLFIGLLVVIFNLSDKWCSIKIKRNITIGMERKVIEKIYRLETLTNRDQLSMLRQTLPQVCEREANWVRGFARTIFAILWSTVFVAVTNWKFVPLTYGVSIIFVLFSWVRQKKIKNLARQYECTYNSLYQSVWEQINNREITPFLNSKKMIRNFQNRVDLFLQDLFQLKKAGNFPQSISMLGAGILMSLSLFYGGYLYLQGKMAMEDIYIIALIVPMLSGVILQLPTQIVDFQILKGGFQIINQYMSEDEYREESKTILNEEIEKIEVRLSKLGYKENPVILRNIFFDIKRGDFIMLIGKSGCGKSTLIKNLAALEYGYKGTIRLNKTDLRFVNRKSYWEKIDYLGQVPSVTNGSVIHNIILHKEWDEVLFEKSIEDAGLGYEITQKDSLETLSSGELQKVCFARIFYQNRPIWFLDEATSALDLNSEEKILQILKQKQEDGKIILAITHREAFMMAASRWFYVNEETVQEVDASNKCNKWGI